MIRLMLKIDLLETTLKLYDFNPAYLNADLYLAAEKNKIKKQDEWFMDALKPELVIRRGILSINVVSTTFKIESAAQQADIDDTVLVFRHNTGNQFCATESLSATRFSKKPFIHFKNSEKLKNSRCYVMNLLVDRVQRCLTSLGIDTEPIPFRATHVGYQFITNNSTPTQPLLVVNNLPEDFPAHILEQVEHTIITRIAQERSYKMIRADQVADLSDIDSSWDVLVLNEQQKNNGSSVQVDNKPVNSFWDAYAAGLKGKKIDLYSTLKSQRLDQQPGIVMQGVDLAISGAPLVPQVTRSGTTVHHAADRILKELWLKEGVFRAKAFSGINLPDAKLKAVFVRRTGAKRSQLFRASVVDITIKKQRLRIDRFAILTSEEAFWSHLSAFSFRRDKKIHNDTFLLFDKTHKQVLMRYHSNMVPCIIGNQALESMALAELPEDGPVTRSKKADLNLLPYYNLSSKGGQRHKIYVQDDHPDLRVFVSSAHAISQKVERQVLIDNLLVFDTESGNGSLLRALEQPVTHVYLNAFTYDLLRLGNASKSTLLEKIAKLYIEN